MDELLTSIPFKGCQLKWDPHEPWGVPADELVRAFKPSVFTSGYVKSEFWRIFNVFFSVILFPLWLLMLQLHPCMMCFHPPAGTHLPQTDLQCCTLSHLPLL